MTVPTAIMDASIVFGASRWIRRHNGNVERNYHEEYMPEDDQQLFLELLHHLVLYEEITLENSCRFDQIFTEVRDMIREINEISSVPIIQTATIADGKFSGSLPAIKATIVDMINKRWLNCVESRGQLLDFPLPWRYRTARHVDNPAFSRLIKNRKLPQELVPYAVFVYRGLCYSRFAHKRAAAYLASPGRLSALRLLVSPEIISRLEDVKHGYKDLMPLLGLPHEGFEFSPVMPFYPHEDSDLTDRLADFSPREALHYVLELRKSSKAEQIRQQWGERIFSGRGSVLIGRANAGNSTNIHASVIHGDVNMIIKANAL